MAYITYFWGFDSTVEGWTGDNVVWEDGGVGGLPTPHLYGYTSIKPATAGYTGSVTFKSPRNLNVSEGDVLCFVLTWDGISIYNGSNDTVSKHLSGCKIEIVDETETVVWSKTIGVTSSPANTPTVCIVKLGASGVGINITVQIYVEGVHGGSLDIHYHYARIDSVTIYAQPDQIIHTPIPSTSQATVTHEIPINKSGTYLFGALRLDAIQNMTSYDEVLIYDSSNEYNYGDGVCVAKETTASIDKVTITHSSDTTLQVYYECDHAIWLLDPSTYYPIWLLIIKCYHNQNVNNPDTLSFSTILDGSAPYSATQSMSLKFVAGGLFNLKITPTAEIIGDTTGITSLTATIEVVDSAGNTLGTCNYDILANSYDYAIDIDKSYDNQDLTVNITVNADGAVSVTVTVYLKLNYDFYT